MRRPESARFDMTTSSTPGRWLARLICLLGALTLSACGGGGGGGGGGGNAGFSVTYDRSSVSLTFAEGDPPPAATLTATAHGTPSGEVLVGATTPSGQPDANIEQVQIIAQSDTVAQVRVVPASGLSVGTHSGHILLLVCADQLCNRHYGGSPFDLSYSFVVTGAIRATPSAVFLQSESSRTATADVQVTLPAGVTSYTATATDGWAQIDNLTATSFRVTAPARAVGTYNTQITLRGGGLTRVVSVQHVATPRRLVLGSSSLALTAQSGSTTSATVEVSQLAEGATTVALQTPPRWLSVSNLSGGGFTLQAASMPSGTYSDTLVVGSGTDTVFLPVSYTVSPSAGGDRFLAVSQPGLTYSLPQGSRSPAQAVGLQRPSWDPQVAVALTYQEGAGWLSFTTRADGELMFSADATGLATGTYRATIDLTGAYPGNPVQVPVSLTVGAGLAVPAPQALVVGSDTVAASLTGTMPVVTNGATALAWTARSSAPWLQLTRAAGSLGESVAWRVDLVEALKLPSYTDQTAGITIDAITPGAPGTAAPFVPVTGNIIVRVELAEVQAVTPAPIVAGQPSSVVVRGRGFDHVADLAARLNVAGTTPASITRLGNNSLLVNLPALGAGTRAVSMANLVGQTTPAANLEVLAAQLHTAAALPTGSVISTVIHDARRRQVFAVDTGLGAIRRWRDDGLAWSGDSLAFAGLLDIGLSPDGAWLVAVEANGQLHLVDPVSFTTSFSFTLPGNVVPTRQNMTGHGLPITNDGKVWLAVGSGFNQMVSFDLVSRSSTVEQLPDNLQSSFFGGPWFEMSRNGERLIAVQSASITPSPPMLYRNTADGVWKVNPAGLDFFYWSVNGLDDNGSRFVSFGTVFDANFARVGSVTLPDAGWLDTAMVLAPDGRRLYVFALPPDWQNPVETTLPRIYVFDTSIAPGTQVNLPFIDKFSLSAYPTCHVDQSSSECFRPVMNVSTDGQTLFVAGSVNLMVTPLPQPLRSPLAARRTKAKVAPVMKPWQIR